MRVLLLLLVGCVSRAPLPTHDWAVTDLAVSELPFCVRGQTRTGAEVALCTTDKRVCVAVSRWARQHGGSWWIRRSWLRLARAGLCARTGPAP